VIDGDTIDVVMGGQTVRVRLIGMDTPETNGAPICYGQEATARTQQLIDAASGKLWLEKDVSETDRYGRLLRYVWLTPSSGSAVGKMLDEQLVVDGYAQVSTFPPDVKYVDRFVVAERAAKAARRGLWGACERFGAPLLAPTAVAVQPTVPDRSSGAGSGNLPYDPNGPDRDCSDFATHAEAQRFFIAAGGPAKDPHRLDGDHDGIACETLP
jgi:micrococcal nuclease